MSNTDKAARTLDAATVKAAARGRWMQVLANLASELVPALAYPGHHSMECPLHGGNSGRAFRVFPDVSETGGGICNSCGSFADGFALLMAINGWSFKETLAAVAGYLGLAPGTSTGRKKAAATVTKPQIVPEVDEAALAKLNKVWRESLPAAHPDAEPMRKYLQRRGILMETYPEDLRFHPSLPYYHDGKCLGTFPAMVAMVRTFRREPVSIHRTFLTLDGFKAAPMLQGERLDSRKLMKSPMPGATRGCAIQLFEAESTLAVAEGIETALSFHRHTGLPVWSALNAGGLERFQIPMGVQELVIAADHDLNGRGQEAARILAEQCKRERMPFRIVTPPEPGTDWNDVLGGGKQA
ncbi:Zinc-binding domain of primase-helicase [compost metagenome]